MAHWDVNEIDKRDLYHILSSSIAPRPIALVSSKSADGTINLSPFSFFNLFGIQPPLLAFSPVTRMRDGTEKNTLNNVKEHQQLCISVVNYDMVYQMSLSSGEYPADVNEFEKSGFTMEKADLIDGVYVKESPISFECEVIEVKRIGESGGAANLVLSEVKMIHIKDEVLDEKGLPNPFALDLVARLGSDWYSRVNAKSLFQVKRPGTHLGIGIDGLPEKIKYSSHLSGNDLGKIGGLKSIPTEEEIDRFLLMMELPKSTEEAIERAKESLKNNQIKEATMLLLRYF